MLLKSDHKSSSLSFILILAWVVYTITAFNSHGYYHADEHYQLIEFARLKLGFNTPMDMAWEYTARARPALQPTLCYVVLRVLDFFSLTDPYTQAFFLRFLSAVFALVSITFFVRNTEAQLDKKDKVLYHLLSFFLWFIPFISVRFSSETWSGLCFLLSLAVFKRDGGKNSTALLIGVLLGLSFLFRFQMLVATVSFLLWLLLINKSKWTYIFKIASVFLSVVLAGVLMDYWFYGDFTFTFLNYVDVNLLKGAAAGFGVSPWYFYLLKLLSYPTYAIGIPLSISILLLIFFRPGNLYLWCLLPFILVHSLVAHKEERFIFPLVFLFPIVLVEAWRVFRDLVSARYMTMVLGGGIAVVFLTVNTVGLIAMAQKSAGLGRMAISKHVHEAYKERPVKLIFCTWANPYNPWLSLPTKFYKEKNVTEKRIDKLCELNDSLFSGSADTVNLLVIRKLDLLDEKCRQVFQCFPFSFEMQSIPPWIENVNQFYEGFDNLNVFELYRYDRLRN